MISLEKISKNNAQGNRLIALSGFGTPILASTVEMSGKIDANSFPIIDILFDVVKDASLYFYILFLGVFLLGKFLTRKGDKQIWEALQVQVNTLQFIAFPNHSNELNDHHRVTLFKYKKWCWLRSLNIKFWEFPPPWSGWLVPVVRSGHTGKDTKVVFWTPDNGNHAEGVAGFCWASDAIIQRENLPKIDYNSTDSNKEKYCRLSNMPRNILNCYCEKNRPLARNLLAFPVKTNTGERWGVLVFDSMSSSGIDNEKAHEAFSVVIEAFGVLLEGV